MISGNKICAEKQAPLCWGRYLIKPNTLTLRARLYQGQVLEG